MKLNIITIFCFLALISACGDSGTDPESGNSKGDGIVLIGGTGAKQSRIAVNGQKLGEFLYATNLDGLLVELLEDGKVISTTTTEESDTYTASLLKYDGFFRFSDLSYDTEYQVRVNWNDTISKTSSPFIIPQDKVVSLDSSQFVLNNTLYPRNITSNLYYLQLMPNKSEELVFDFDNKDVDIDLKTAVSPTPAISRVSFTMTLPQGSQCTLALLKSDMTKINSIVDMYFNKGNHSIEINLDDLENGMYFFELKYEDQTELIPFIKFDIE